VIMAVPTPVKLAFNADFLDNSDGAQRGFDMQRLAESVFPSRTMTIPPKENRCTIKAPILVKWNKTSVDIHEHLMEAKRICEISIRRGQLSEPDDYFDLLLDSVKVPALTAWHNKWASVYERDPQKLLVLLLSAFHSPLGETKSYNSLIALPLNVSTLTLSVFIDNFERLILECSDMFTAKGQCHELVRHLSSDISCKLNLLTTLQTGCSLLELINKLRAEAMAGEHRDTLSNGGMAIDVVEEKKHKPGPRCFNCNGYGHLANACPSPKN
jgi:hypothetical protein